MNRLMTLAVALTLVATPGVVRATDATPIGGSVTYTEAELFTLEQAIAAGPLARLDSNDPAGLERSRLRRPLYLSAIVYKSPANWAVWINDQQISPGTGTSLYHVIEVRRDDVRLLIPWGDDTLREVRLAVNQSFQPQLNRVITGQTP